MLILVLIFCHYFILYFAIFCCCYNCCGIMLVVVVVFLASVSFWRTSCVFVFLFFWYPFYIGWHRVMTGNLIQEAQAGRQSVSSNNISLLWQQPHCENTFGSNEQKKNMVFWPRAHPGMTLFRFGFTFVFFF